MITKHEKEQTTKENLMSGSKETGKECAMADLMHLKKV